jgi:hypothetical protein
MVGALFDPLPSVMRSLLTAVANPSPAFVSRLTVVNTRL